MSKVKTSTPSVSELQHQVKALDQNWKRALADYHNLKRRIEHDKSEFVKLANANLIARLIPSLDVIELAAAHNEDIGVQMAARQFHEALNQEGLQVISPGLGDAFDSSLHECIETLDLPGDKQQNTIAEVSLKGYRIGDYILRPAKVKVFRVPENIHSEPVASDATQSRDPQLINQTGS
ncbi:nucleotide exchange factor GrpE [Candidatus Amesbacteria bacterium RIFCSPLOWO2_02_FULL_48_11]|uniref:Protein GrpE n=4 Tax=Candidatus Amesiibacteriota TaxID=1752730 RepID=A0A1F4Z7J7_9BACT|nr:MAG: Protein GrpE [Candidatus Amesbacteria bacterium GW2011_GWA2_47_11]KKU93486.1 MAG: Protein GrpE [Candidatus Amesbacteria bacterium GW2011_GWC1_48_10]KKW01023.1 MAG: Protein GrpE [Candidatus Amesbacteria bacterium GW2011_GWA1_48_9]OGC89605.1 MAG: nucleotide exchange factor GrpE [Candidatus Amesbacteria bacterium RBG_19FT_COMBO_48_16]OGC96849.1 MAG: nucleotide exchange factor GrpE [Candidatus Amesbacteria bacterium RIFCSPHIGHO2_02_FULL_48_21]OGC97850.1 MAG: nucleotide exchange factor GrpE